VGGTQANEKSLKVSPEPYRRHIGFTSRSYGRCPFHILFLSRLLSECSGRYCFSDAVFVIKEYENVRWQLWQKHIILYVPHRRKIRDVVSV
jgi:hypothetical protein